MKSSTALFIILIVLILSCLLPAAGCSQNQLKIIDHKITVHKFAGDTVHGLAVVSGQAQNSGIEDISLASITVEFYDKDSKFLSSAQTTFENLKPNATWFFSAQFDGPDAWKASTYKVINSTK
jgi:hypothetical protein